MTATGFNLEPFHSSPHRRFNPLIGEWVLISPQRTQRPWQGQTETIAPEVLPPYDPFCYLCPGNVRAGGVQNPQYAQTFVFENDFAALKPQDFHTKIDFGQKGILLSETESGLCRVVCFSPRHDLTLARMLTSSIRVVVDLWAGQLVELGSKNEIRYVQIFENRGAMMGASNPHPHGQIWASASLPDYPAKEQAALRNYQAQHGQCLLCEYIQLERASGERMICENEHFMAVVPFWAVWPFESLVLSTRHVKDLTELSDAERESLAEILKRLTIRYDNLFDISFPYSMGFHQRPTDGLEHPEWHLHAHFFPPLLRSATVRKFMVGYELLASPQRDITPESAAAQLRELSEIHFSE